MFKRLSIVFSADRGSWHGPDCLRSRCIHLYLHRFDWLCHDRARPIQFISPTCWLYPAPMQPWVSDSRNGVEIAIDDAGGKILNHTIKFDGEDGLCSADGGQAAGTKLASDPDHHRGHRHFLLERSACS